MKKILMIATGGTLTPEALITKLMWILGRTNDREEAAKLFYTPVQADLL